MKSPIYFIAILFVVLGLNACEKSNTGSSDTKTINTTGKGGSLARFTIVGNYLYTIDKSSLRIYDISSANNPVFKNKVDIGWNIETIYPFRNKLFIAGSNGMYMYSLANPVQPASEGEVQHITSCDPVVANDKAAYLTLRGGNICGSTVNRLEVYDVSNSLNQSSFKTSIELNEPYGLGLNKNALYVCDKQKGLIVYDITSSYLPVEQKSISGEAYMDVINYDDQLMIAMKQRGISYFNISNPLDPQLLSSINE